MTTTIPQRVAGRFCHSQRTFQPARTILRSHRHLPALPCIPVAPTTLPACQPAFPHAFQRRAIPAFIPDPLHTRPCLALPLLSITFMPLCPTPVLKTCNTMAGNACCTHCLHAAAGCYRTHLCHLYTLDFSSPGTTWDSSFLTPGLRRVLCVRLGDGEETQATLPATLYRPCVLHLWDHRIGSHQRISPL